MSLKKIIQKQLRKFIEKGADLEHQRWARWQKWCHKILRENCPSPELENVLKRWDRQIATKYSDLSEPEKESDRKEVRKYLPFLSTSIEEAVGESLGEVEKKLEKRFHEAVQEKANVKNKRWGKPYWQGQIDLLKDLIHQRKNHKEVLKGKE